MTHDFLESSPGSPGATPPGCPFIPVFGPPKVMFVRGEGTHLWSSDGRHFLDFLSGISVVNLGHSNPAVTRRVSRQLETLSHVSNFFANDSATHAAMRLNRLMGDCGAGDGQVFFCNSGAEANEAAIKLARKFGGRGRHVIVSALGSFHGRTLGALALTGQPSKHESFQPMPEGFRYCEFGNVDSLTAALDESVAAVVLEVVQGEGGVIPAPPGYLAQVQEECSKRGILFILDEVQTGFCRTGRWFAFEHEGLKPDAVTLAKAMGNGFPVGALWARREVAAVMAPGDHGSTFSGTALATAAVMAVIDEMERINAPALAVEKGARLRESLGRLKSVEHVRGVGLLLGAVLRPGLDARSVADEALARGVIVNPVNHSTLRLAPPLTVTDEEIDQAVAILSEVIE